MLIKSVNPAGKSPLVLVYICLLGADIGSCQPLLKILIDLLEVLGLFELLALSSLLWR